MPEHRSRRVTGGESLPECNRLTTEPLQTKSFGDFKRPIDMERGCWAAMSMSMPMLGEHRGVGVCGVTFEDGDARLPFGR